MGLWLRIKSAFGGGAVMQPIPLHQQFQRIGGSLTPAQVSNIIEVANTGRPSRLIDLSNEARQKDGHLQSVLGTREGAVPKLKWVVKAPEKSRARDRKAAAFCEEAIRQAMAVDNPDNRVCGFPDMLAHLSGAAYHGFAVAETLLKKEGGKIVPAGWTRAAPRRFIFTIDTGELRWYDEMTMAYPGVDFLGKYPNRFIAHQPRINGDVLVREGLARVLMWAALFRNWDIRDWMSLAELAWKPWRTGVYKTAATLADVNNLVAILDGMASTGIAVHSENTDVKVEWPKNSFTGTSAHGELAAFLGAEMSKAVLGQTLTTEQGSKGSQALGNVHDEVRRDILEADAKAIAATLRRFLLAPLVRLNFGDDVMIPEIEFLTQDPVDLKAFSEGVSTMAGAGVPMPVRWVWDQAGVPEPEDGDLVIGKGGIVLPWHVPEDPPEGAAPALPAADGAAGDPNADVQEAA